MISADHFEAAAAAVLGRNISAAANPEQHAAVAAPANESLFLVAGPGSGKTTVIALRVLKLVLIDGVDPRGIMATTFTKKAAGELRSRILGWGDSLRNHLSPISDPPVAEWLRGLDFNQVRSGTIDSIAQDLLTEFRPAGRGAPVVLEDFVATGVMLRAGLFEHGRHRDADLQAFAKRILDRNLINAAAVTGALRTLADRLINDQVDLQRYAAQVGVTGLPAACAAINDYVAELRAQQLLDFALLSQEFLDALRLGTLEPFLRDLNFVLVDEYQDTNLLQEQLYFALAAAPLQHGGSITVVGDDDQSLYRFRGATVEIFRDFQARFRAQFQVVPTVIHLNRNYRSTNSIVTFVNAYVSLDTAYQAARVPNKPALQFARADAGGRVVDYPVLGMFRDTAPELADDLAAFIGQVVNGPGYVLGRGRAALTIRLDPAGSAGDIAVLSSTASEFSSGGTARLPLLLRDRLSDLPRPIRLFNPRGRSLHDVPSVQRLCGLLLECIDAGANVQSAIPRLPRDVLAVFGAWRAAGQALIRADQAAGDTGLAAFVHSWAIRQPLRTQAQGRVDVALNELVYKIVTWIPEMQGDPESLAYLEAITRTIDDSTLLGGFRSQVIFQPGVPTLADMALASVREAIWNIFVPLATGAIDLNEELFETLPPDRVSLMTIHQAKGLEFPLIVVDVGSDFKTNHAAQAFKRFPRTAGAACTMEDEVRPFSQLPPGGRRGLDRAYDDLIRQYFVAFSRAQDVLLLTGLTAVRDGIKNLATGWDRGNQWHWQNRLANLVHI